MTIIIGVQCADGNIIVADGRVMANDFILRDDEPKVVLINNILLAGSGNGAAVQHIEREVHQIRSTGSEAAVAVSAIINKSVLDHPMVFDEGSYFFSTGPKDLYYQRVSKEQTLPFRIDRFFVSGVGYPIAQYLLHKFTYNIPDETCEAAAKKTLRIIRETVRFCAEIGGKLSYGCYTDKPVLMEKLKKDANEVIIACLVKDSNKKKG